MKRFNCKYLETRGARVHSHEKGMVRMLGIVATRTNLIRLMGFVIIALGNLSKLTIVNIQTNPLQHLVCATPVTVKRKMIMIK